MNIEEKTKQEIWYILQKIKKNNILTPEKYYTKFDIETTSKTPDFDTQIKIIEMFEHEKIIKINSSRYSNPLRSSLAIVYQYKPDIYFLDVIQPQFDKFYKKYKVQCDNKPIVNIKEAKIQYRKGRIIYGNIAEYAPSKLEYVNILDFLWCRKQIRNNQGEVISKKSGNPYRISNLSEEIKLSEEELKKALKHLNTEIHKKRIPIKISQKGERALLILTEK